MMVTIVTLEDNDTDEHYVGAIMGTVSAADRVKVADRLNACIWPSDDDESSRVVYFRETMVADKPDNMTHVQNIDGDEI